MRKRSCVECGAEFTTKRAEAEFCSDGCRKVFQNRRMLRGAAIYDLFMVLRYERGVAKAIGAWTLMCRLAQQWRDEDREKRAGRQSWTRASKLRGMFTAAHAVVVVKGKR